MRASRLILSALAVLVSMAGAGAAGAVTVAPGDTLSDIAARAGLSVGELAAANGIDNPNMIRAGQTLSVPGGGGGGGYGAGSVTVGPGDTLGEIAARHGTTASALAAANGLRDPNLIRVGQTLRLSGSGGGGLSGGSGGSVTVAPGDTLGEIASRAGTTVSALASANGIEDPNLIRVGQTLDMPGSSGAASGTVPAGGYRVLPGDTLGTIALNQGTTTAALASLNGLEDPNDLKAGTVLWVPTAAVPSASGSSRSDVGGALESAAERHGVDPALARALAWQESGWNQAARSHAGAIGVMQLLPSTARWVGPTMLGRRIDPRDLGDNVEGGMALLSWLREQTGSTRTALASYYQGLTSVRRDGPLPETKLYVANVLAQVGRV